jgi:hypothetical protein
MPSVSWQSMITHAKLVTRFDKKAFAYSSIPDWLRRHHFGETIFEPGIHSSQLSESLPGFRILRELAVFPFYKV